MPDSTLATSRRHLEKARDYARELIAQASGDKTLAARLYADSLNGLGAVSILDGDLPTAEALLNESRNIFDGLGDQSTKSSVIRHLAEIADLQHRSGDAVKLCNEAIKLATDAARQDRVADAFMTMAMIEQGRGATKKAQGYAEKAQRAYLSIGAIADAGRVVKQLADKGRQVSQKR
jgi:tetratricopeptide (TPR) repeat protein